MAEKSLSLLVSFSADLTEVMPGILEAAEYLSIKTG